MSNWIEVTVLAENHKGEQITHLRLVNFDLIAFVRPMANGDVLIGGPNVQQMRVAADYIPLARELIGETE